VRFDVDEELGGGGELVEDEFEGGAEGVGWEAFG
jgi:hypothetical protein